PPAVRRRAPGEGRGMKFSYRAFDKSGQSRADVIEAGTEAEASEALRRQGLFVAEVRPAEGAAAGPKRPRARRGSGKGRFKNVASFMRHLSVLVSTGTPVVEGLAALEKQALDERWRAVIADIRTKVEEGVPLSEALAGHPRCFDTICRSLVRAGESGGKLDLMLGRLAEL